MIMLQPEKWSLADYHKLEINLHDCYEDRLRRIERSQAFPQSQCLITLRAYDELLLKHFKPERIALRLQELSLLTLGIA